MRLFSDTVRLALTLLIVLGAYPRAQAPVRDTAASPIGTAVIRGRVVATDTGRPLRVARVTLAGEPPFRAQTTISDDDGRYEFRNLPAGRYTVTAGKETYLTLSYGQTRPSQAGRLLNVGDKQIVDEVNFGLPAGGVITGTVTDEFGDAIIAAGVTPMQTTFKDGRRLVVAAGPTESTNDLGEFRLSGLQPGSYFVHVKRALAGIPAGAIIGSNLTAVPVYAPGTPNIAAARRVRVDVGRTIAGVDVIVARVQTASISGTIFDLQGRPLRWAYVELREAGVFDPAPVFAEQGLNPGITSGFTFNHVPSGTYEIRATINGMLGALAPGAAPQAAIARVSVSGEHISGIRITPFDASKVTGRIVVDREAAKSLPIASVGLSLRSTDPAEPPSWVAHVRPVSVAPDLTFSMFALPGRWTFFPSTDGLGVTQALPKGWGLKAVRVGGVDVTDAGFEVRQGVDVRDVEVELTNRPPQVSGSVKGSRGESVDDYTVLLFARDRTRWNGNARYFAMARPDQTGMFSVSTLAPGDYFAIALEYVDVNEAQDPELLDRVSKNAVTLTLAEGEARSLELKIVP